MTAVSRDDGRAWLADIVGDALDLAADADNAPPGDDAATRRVIAALADIGTLAAGVDDARRALRVALGRHLEAMSVPRRQELAAATGHALKMGPAPTRREVDSRAVARRLAGRLCDEWDTDAGIHGNVARVIDATARAVGAIKADGEWAADPWRQQPLAAVGIDLAEFAATHRGRRAADVL